jgi:hypothetical protein
VPIYHQGRVSWLSLVLVLQKEPFRPAEELPLGRATLGARSIAGVVDEKGRSSAMTTVERRGATRLLKDYIQLEDKTDLLLTPASETLDPLA